MGNINLIAKIELVNGGVKDADVSPVKLCTYYSNSGAEGIIIEEISNTDSEHDANIDVVKAIVSAVDVPVYMGGSVKRLEDVKKYIYTGASMAILDLSKESNVALVKEATERFGSEKIMIKATNNIQDSIIKDAITNGASVLLTDNDSSYDVLN
jgi:phosphoribosyl-ATP pyrophosphohydrolase/phosphoribosyl-AMP cyclohydrolase